MGKGRLIDRMCGRKRRHKTEKEARKHMEALPTVPGERMNVYKCWICQHWHVGHAKRIPPDG